MTAGRPTKYLQEFCDRVIEMAKNGASKHEMALEFGKIESLSIDEAKKISEKVVYLLHNDEFFYVGSTKRPKIRFQSYFNKNTHGNQLLKQELEKDWRVKIIYMGENYREVEHQIIKALSPKCNISKIKFNNKRYGHFYSYCTIYSNRFGKTEFYKQITSFFKGLDCTQKEIINNNFKLFFENNKGLQIAKAR